ncbi:BLUF domain-containing protein [Porphyrobacter sp. GA68]|uniref:BLUF domain-containing protein n=1 Tax=Porphyrobacter sp. GA68 TaxID=2883480 RepID=UPI001D1980E1|nr:BLUF domain-containing protein [Porphyrobacter sp. GA68]
MRQIAYTSVATDELGQDDLFRIVEKSVSNNMDRGVTGFLVYAGNQFFQLIEGEEVALRGLLRTLEKDTRHCDIQIVLDLPAMAARFPRWRMQRVGRTGDALAQVRAELAKDQSGQQVLRHLHGFIERTGSPELVGQ